MKRRHVPATILAAAFLAALFGPAPLRASGKQNDLVDLEQVMTRAVETASKSVVRIIVLDTTKADQQAARKDLEKQEGRDAAKGKPKPADPGQAAPPKAANKQAAAPSRRQEKVGQPHKAAESPAAAKRKRVRSGLVVSPDGYIITSLVNVGQQKTGLEVELPDGRVLAAKRLGQDSQRDVLLLKVEARRLQAPRVAAKSTLAVGQWVVALGKALPIDRPTATKGIISALGRLSGVAIQTDAKISPINYGGPLVDLRGRVIAMVAAVSSKGSSAVANRWSDSGIGFAIPLEDILARLPLLKEGKHIEPPFLGIQFNMVRLQRGAKVLRVIAGTAAAASGLQDGDVIVEFQGATIDTPFQLLYQIGSRSVGDEITFKVRRNGKTLTLKATIGARPDRYR